MPSIEEFLSPLRRKLQGISPDCFLRQECDPSLTKEFLEIYEFIALFGYDEPLDMFTLGKVKRSLTWASEIDSFTQQHCKDDLKGDTIVLVMICCLFDIEGATIRSGILFNTYPNLQYDRDGLFVGETENRQLVQNGLVTSQHFVPYHSSLLVRPGNLSLSGGFLETLFEAKQEHPVEHFGLRLAEDVLVDRRFYTLLETRAYIRGPKGISPDVLCHNRFPEDITGTVTVHERHKESQNSQIRRFEVMWSLNPSEPHIKTVQMEEIFEPDSAIYEADSFILNRYVHSQWDCSARTMVHFDGAIRVYPKSDYSFRIDNDIKKSGKSAASYTKLFRIDSSLNLATWSDLVAKFFYNNDLVSEYFDEHLRI